MFKTKLSALAAAVVVGFAPAANAALTFDLNGAGAGGVIVADSFDWFQTSLLAKGINPAIETAANGRCGPNGEGCTFDILTHAKLTGYLDLNGDPKSALGFGEITMISRFTQVVTGVTFDDALGTKSGTPFGFLGVEYATTGAGWLEFYYSATEDSAATTGFGFNSGRLIGRLEGTGASSGGFDVTGFTPVKLDQVGTDQYAGQETLTGTGSQGELQFGTTNQALDFSFFKTGLSDFSIFFSNISIAVPFGQTNPSHCFNEGRNLGAVGTTGLTSSCDNVVANAKFAGQSVGAGNGILANIGDINLFSDAPDVVAQSDFNSSVTGTVPEPASLALFGLALAGAAAASRRRRVN